MTAVLPVLSWVEVTSNVFMDYSTEPAGNIPKAIFISLAVTVLLPVSRRIAAVGALGSSASPSLRSRHRHGSNIVHADRVPIIQYGAALIVSGAVFSTLTALNAVVVA